MKLVYIQHLDRYLDVESKSDPTYLYTDDELDFYLFLEYEHKKTLPKYNLNELIELYPTAKAAAKRNIAERLRIIKVKISGIDTYREEYTKKFIDTNPDFLEKKYLSDDLETFIETYMKQLESEKSMYQRQLQYIKRELTKENLNKVLKSKKATQEKKDKATNDLNNLKRGKGVIDQEIISRARSIPIADFIKVGRDGKAKCIFHNERTPSMHIYKNGFKCFSCGKSGSVIDIVMQLENLSFVEAVKRITNI